MAKRWIAANLLLLATAALLARQLHVSIVRFNTENDLSKIQPARDIKQMIAQDSPLPKMPPARSYSAADFAVIPEKNIFSETRSMEEKGETAAPLETPPLVQKPILVGVVISDTQKTATIIDPSVASPNQTRRAQIKRVGDFYHGYKITAIDPDRIVLESGTRREIIPLHEGSKRARGGKTPVLSTRVAAIGSGSAGGGIPVSVVAGGSGGARTTAPAGVPASVPIGQPAAAQATAGQTRQAAGVPASVYIGQPAAAQATTGQTRQATGVAQQQIQPPQAQRGQQPAPGTGATGAQGQRVIRTPFGTIVQQDPDD